MKVNTLGGYKSLYGGCMTVCRTCIGQKIIFMFGKNVCIINNNKTKLIKNLVTTRNFTL